MANTLRIKRRTAGNAGAPTALANAELAFNEVNNTLYYGKGDNGSGVATSVIAIGGDGTFATKSYVDTSISNADLSSYAKLAASNTFAEGFVNTFNGTVNLEGTFKIDDVTVLTSAAELNVLDGVTAGTVSASKAVVVDANEDVYGFRGLTAKVLTAEGDGLYINTASNAPVMELFTATGSSIFRQYNPATTDVLASIVDGAITGTSVNKVTITAPATSATLTIANGKTLTASSTLTFTGTDDSSVAFGTGGTVAYTANTLAAFAATTSSQLAGVISDATGSGSLVFGTSPTITTSIVAGSSSMDIFNTTATTVNAFGAATALSIGAATGTTTVNNSLSVTGSGTFGSLSAAGNAFSVDGSGNVIASGTGVFSALQADGVDIGVGNLLIAESGEITSTSGAAFGGNLTVAGNLTINGTTTTINSTTLSVDDKNIVLGDVATPSNATADGGGITLKGTTDKTINWVNATGAWTSSEDFNLLAGKVYEINGTEVLSAAALGSGVVSSSLTSVGTIGAGVWQGTAVAVAYGGTGATDAAGARTNLGLGTGASVTFYNITASDIISAGGEVRNTGSGVISRLVNGDFMQTSVSTGSDLYKVSAGVITQGTWNGTTIAVANGGTGATTAADARTNLGLVIGTDVQAYDAELQALAGLTSAANALPYFTGAGTADVTTLSSFGRTLIDDADASAARTTLGLVIGTNVQAYDAELAALAGLTSAADRLPYFTGSGTASLAVFTAFGRSLADDVDAAAARTTLGLGSIATQDASNVSITGGAIDNVVLDGGTF